MKQQSLHKIVSKTHERSRILGIISILLMVALIASLIALITVG